MSKRSWEDVRKRSVLSFAIIACVFLLVFFSQIFWMRIAVALVILCLIASAAGELLLLARSREKSLSLAWPVAASVFLGVSFFLASQFSFFEKGPLFVFFCFSLLFFFINFLRVEGSLLRISFSFFSLAYVALPLSLIFLILYSSAFDGRIWIAYLLTVTKMGDIAAYFGGKFFGKRKLAPLLSPKKTREGAIIGALMSVGMSFLFFYWGLFLSEKAFTLNWQESLWLGLLMSLAGQTGDLAESLLKRDAKIKESGWLPGLGGVLDMVDSLLFSIPLLYLFLISR